MLLYLTSNQKSGLIDGVTREMLMPSKKLVGKFSLKSFVTKDMRNYATAKFFLIDAACIEESGEDFALALRSFQMMFSARIIVILSGCEDMSGCIQQLLSIGVVNLITAETLEDAADELREALSDEGMQRYVSSAPASSQPEPRQEPALEPEDEITPYRWNAKNVRIAVAGAQRRSGVTVTAFNLAAWLTARGAEVAYIEVNTNRHLQLLLNVYEAAPTGEHYAIDGIDCYLTNEPDRDYQFVIYECSRLPLCSGKQIIGSCAGVSCPMRFLPSTKRWKSVAGWRSVRWPSVCRESSGNTVGSCSAVGWKWRRHPMTCLRTEPMGGCIGAWWNRISWENGGCNKKSIRYGRITEWQSLNIWRGRFPLNCGRGRGWCFRCLSCIAIRRASVFRPSRP